ncbi:DUF6197 family protein [Streptomyces tubercidicus]|uniref:DUF6197 family protein n=1 Tax=Streptomyces tubercidicus TaxID=47759 RepID=UPI0036C98EC6
MYGFNSLSPSQRQHLTTRAFVRDVENYLAGTAVAVQPDGDRTESLIETAFQLSLTRYRDGWLRWGSSGMPMTGEQIAAHAEAAINILRAGGWNPSCHASRSIRDALIHAETADEHQGCGMDTRMVVGDILGLLIRALTGAPTAYYETWDAHPARTVEEVFTALAAAAVFARRYGDKSHPAQATA